MNTQWKVVRGSFDCATQGRRDRVWRVRNDRSYPIRMIGLSVERNASSGYCLFRIGRVETKKFVKHRASQRTVAKQLVCRERVRDVADQRGPGGPCFLDWGRDRAG